MAGVQYKKIKNVGQLKAYFRHDDKVIREITEEHSNEHINKELTKNNAQMSNRAYADTCKFFDDRIAYLDSHGNTNRRHDRVVAFGLYVPLPDGIPDGNKPFSSDDKQMVFAKKVLHIVQEQYGKDNVVQCYLHRDEQHDYVDAVDGSEKESLHHLHIYVVPEHNGKLNGKWFSSRSNMVKLNKSIDTMCSEEFGLHFVKNSNAKSRGGDDYIKGRKASVEDLKIASRTLEEQLSESIAAKQLELTLLEERVEEETEKLQQKEKESQTIAKQSEAEQRKLERLREDVARMEQQKAKGIEDLEEVLRLCRKYPRTYTAQAIKKDLDNGKVVANIKQDMAKTDGNSKSRSNPLLKGIDFQL